MSGLLIDTCAPSLMSAFPHSSSQLDWYQLHPTNPTPSASTSRSPTRDNRPTRESQVQILRTPFGGHDHETIIAANLPLPLSREPSPFVGAAKDIQVDTQVDDAVMSGNDQRQMNQRTPQRQPAQQQESGKEVSGIQRKESAISPTSATSAKSMPTPQLTFTEATAQADGGLLEEEEEEELSGTPSDAEDENTTGSTAKTAAERLAEKRKMKRFRLTHSQTRFLMSEFSRQPHPDAAQRDRLSKDIPGLSPRQVQVWFQNRRAKMKRLTGDDQERMMRSRALPTGFDLSRALQPTSGEQSQSPSALAHLIGPNTNLPGGSSIGRPLSRSDRRDVPPINMALVYRNPSYSLNSAGGSSNVSPSTSIDGDPAYSANQSPMFAGSQNSSPFFRSGGDSFSRTFSPTSLGLSTQGNFRARSGSLMNLPPTSPLSGGSPMVYPRERVSMENMQAMYESQYSGSSQPNRSLDPQLGGMANLQVHSPSLHSTQNYQSTGLMRRNSSSAMVSTMTGSSAETSFENPEWFNLSSNEQLPNSDFQLQAHQIRRRQTQPTHPTQQYQPSGMATLSPTTQPQSPFSSTTYQQARQPSPSQQVTPYVPPAAFPTEAQQARRPSYVASPTHGQSPVRDRISPTDVYQQQQHQQQQGQSYQQGQKYPEYYQPSSQGPAM